MARSCAAALCYAGAVVCGAGALGYYVYTDTYAEHLQGARDLALDVKRGVVLVAALHANALTVVDVRGAAMEVARWRADEAFGNAHGFAYDAERQIAFVTSYTRHSVAAVDARTLDVLGVLRDEATLNAATHAAYDAATDFAASCALDDRVDDSVETKQP